MIVIAAGYCAGIVHKYIHDWDWVVALYVVNFLMVLTDLFLYFHYLPRDRVRVVEGGPLNSNGHRIRRPASCRRSR